MLEARVRVTDHALVFTFWFFLHLQLAQMLQEIVREGHLWGRSALPNPAT
jgi:hypothetical protein